MQYKYESAEKSTVKITIQFDATEWKNAVNKSYNQNKARYAVAGFRKGKAPKAIIESFYGKGVFFEGAFNILYNEHFGEIVMKEQANFTVVGEPALSVESLSDDGLTLVALTPVKPDVAIEAYKGLKIKEYVYNVSDADVEEEVKRLQDRNARQVPVTDRAAQNGDVANIDFVGTVNGEKFDGGSAEGYDLTLGSGMFIPGFEDQVVGMSIGEVKDINVTFPESYQIESLKGQAAVFNIKLNALTGKELPEVNDEFVKNAAGCETVDEFKAKAKERLQRQADKKGRDDTENSIIAAISEKATAEIPQAMIEAQIDTILQNVNNQLMYQGLDLDGYLEYLKISKEDFRKNYEEQAKRNVMSQLVIEKLIKLEGIGATEAEVDAKIAEQAASVEKPVEEYKKNMPARQKDYIVEDLILTKLFDFLKKNNEMFVEA